MERAAQAPLEEQGFLGLGPGCFRTLYFWRAVWLGELLCVTGCHPWSPPGQPGGSSVLLPCSGEQCWVWRRSRAVISASRVVLAKTIRHMPANS